MEINRFEHRLYGVVTAAAIVEGRAGVMDGAASTFDYGSRTDLPKFHVPATAEEAKRANYVVTWAQAQLQYPQFLPIPSFSFSMRQGGWDQATQTPTAVTMYLTDPAAQESVEIPSGTPALAFGTGVYTIPSGQYIADDGLHTPGALVQVANTAEDTTDAGKFKYLATMSDRKVGRVVEYDSTTAKLTVELD